MLAFVRVKTRTPPETSPGWPEAAVNSEKATTGANARRFLRQRCIGEMPRFEVLAIDSPRGSRPEVRLHKGAFGGSGEVA